jgi:hypothetical protein
MRDRLKLSAFRIEEYESTTNPPNTIPAVRASFIARGETPLPGLKSPLAVRVNATPCFKGGCLDASDPARWEKIKDRYLVALHDTSDLDLFRAKLAGSTVYGYVRATWSSKEDGTREVSSVHGLYFWEGAGLQIDLAVDDVSGPWPSDDAARQALPPETIHTMVRDILRAWLAARPQDD